MDRRNFLKTSDLPIAAPVFGLCGPVESYAEECPSPKKGAWPHRLCRRCDISTQHLLGWKIESDLQLRIWVCMECGWATNGWGFGPAELADCRPHDPDTLESLAAEFEWELDHPHDIKRDMFGGWYRLCVYIHRNGRSSCIDIHVMGNDIPLREQFVYHTAMNDAFAKCDN